MEAPVAAVLGLTYKPGTSTLRRSTSLEHCTWLHRHGVCVRAHDPAVTELPEALRSTLTLCASPEEALTGADVALVATEWSDYRGLDGDTFVRTMRQPCVIDPNHFLASKLAADPRITYVATGRAAA
jgi:UDPglucose 6-dehydrogenase